MFQQNGHSAKDDGRQRHAPALYAGSNYVTYPNLNVQQAGLKRSNLDLPGTSRGSRGTFNVDVKNRSIEFAGSNRSLNEKSATVQKPGTSLGTLPMPKPKMADTGRAQNKDDEDQSRASIDKSRARFPKFGTQETEKTFIFTGTIERILKWAKIFENHFCYFEVIAPVIAVNRGKVQFEQVMLMRDKKGPVLQVVYYGNATHVNIENFHFEQVLRCVGRMVSPNTMSAVTIRGAFPQEIETLPRLCCVCDRAIQYFCSSA
ncbi:uncharacterized protein LOC132699681 [Cylas formicarius]|uniref:uncharacterized protein LOC132699681 n=1 Tax=Cylas formicarius TaxID=197179 RepID=UPI002958726A|nr:uncharacterized protein LOC132699681 [Cylas formicarius]